MKRIVGIVYVFLCWGISLHAQSVRVIETLKKLEMENISVVEKSDTITAAFETSVYRGAYNGIGIAIRHLVAMPEMPDTKQEEKKPETLQTEKMEDKRYWILMNLQSTHS